MTGTQVTIIIVSFFVTLAIIAASDNYAKSKKYYNNPETPCYSK